nr:RNA-directed DNA polymerase, eukaryota [Tanacetum cinerariifolium]
NKDCLVKDRYANGDWSWDCIRHIYGGRVLDELNTFLMDLNSISLSTYIDSVSSSFSSDGIFSISSIRSHIDDCMMLNPRPCTWSKIIPRKINIFMWRLFLDRLPHRFNLSLRGLEIDSIIDGAVQVFLRFPPRKIWMFGISLREPLDTKSFKLSVFFPLLVGCYGALKQCHFSISSNEEK